MLVPSGALTSGLQGMGLRIVPSDANFVMVVLDTTQQAIDLSERLLRQGIVIRPLRAFGLPNCVRVSTGTDDQIEAVSGSFSRAVRALR